MVEKHEALLYHTEVRWLSRGRIINRLIELRKAVQAFQLEKKAGLAECFSNRLWLFRLCYISDIFTELNKDNLTLQGYNVTVIEAKKIHSYIHCRDQTVEEACGSRHNGPVLYTGQLP